MRLEASLLQRLCGGAAFYSQSPYVATQAQCLLPPWLPQAARLLRTLTEAPEQFVSLNSLRDNPGATHAVSWTSLMLACPSVLAHTQCMCTCSLSGLGGVLVLAQERHQGEATRDKKLEQVLYMPQQD